MNAYVIGADKLGCFVTHETRPGTFTNACSSFRKGA